MVKLCPLCDSQLEEIVGSYHCPECAGVFSEDEVTVPRCPDCGSELEDLSDDEFYCSNCSKYVTIRSAVLSRPDEDDYEVSGYTFDEPDFDSRINNGEAICLNCTYWSVSPYGASHGMICRRGYPTDGPGDSCSDFIGETHFANYGSEGQYQFNETSGAISNKLYHWKNNR